MKKHTSAALTAAALLSSLSGIAHADWDGAYSNNPVYPTTARQLVVLRAVDDPTNCGVGATLRAINDLGQASSTLFAVPANAQLVITDVVWSAKPGASGWLQGQPVTLSIFYAWDGGTAGAPRLRALSAPVTSETSSGLASQHAFSHGINVGPRNFSVLCAKATSPSTAGGSDDRFGNLTQLHVYGYIVQNTTR